MAQSFYLREQADRCRRLAHGTSDPVTRERLLQLAGEYAARADADEGEEGAAPRLAKGCGQSD